MPKIKYATGQSRMFYNRPWRSRPRLYKYSVPVPGYMSILILATISLVALGIFLLEPGTGNEFAKTSFVAANIVGIFGAIVGFITALESPGWYVMGYMYRFPTRECPKDMHFDLVPNEYYQEALQEHWNGKDIGSMAPLNNVLKNRDNVIARPKSDVVELLANRAQDEYNFIKMGQVK